MVSKNIVVVIPAYNESKNIGSVVIGIRKEFPESKIIIIDDSKNSEFIKTKKTVSTFRNVEVVGRGSKKGRGSAVLEGLKLALKDKNAKYFFEMDGDQSHEPTHLNRFLKAVRGRVGMVIGSRYVKGGTTGEITRGRLLLSWMINRFLRIMLDVKLADYTSGYRLYTRSAVEFLVKSKLKSSGFITLSEITFKLHRKKFGIVEVPVTITKRKYGKSTVGAGELISSLLFVFRMRIESYF